MLRHLLIIAFMLSLSACGTSPKTNFYVLNTEFEMPSNTEGLGIGIWKVRLPLLLDRSEIVTRSGQYEIELADFHHWAGGLGANINTLIGHELSQRLNTVRISTSPWPAHKINDYQVKIFIDRFDGELGGVVEFSGIWILLNGKGNKELTRQSFEFSSQVGGKKYSDMVASLSELVVQLSGQIATAIKSGQK